MRWNISYVNANGAVVKEVIRVTSGPCPMEQAAILADSEMDRIVGADGGWIISPADDDLRLRRREIVAS